MVDPDEMRGEAGKITTRGWSIDLYARYVEFIESLCMVGHAREMWQLGASLARVSDGDRVLDVGCGTGPLSRAVKNLCPGSRVIGIDPSPRALKFARRRAEKESLDIDFRQGVIEKIPLGDECIDIAVSCMVLHHLPRDLKREGLQEVHRVLIPGGHIMMIDVGPGNHHWFSQVISFLYQWDLFEWLRDGIKGRLPSIMEEAGFENCHEILSAFTSMSYFWAEKSVLAGQEAKVEVDSAQVDLIGGDKNGHDSLTCLQRGTVGRDSSR